MSRHFERDFTTDQLAASAGGLSSVDGGPMTLAIVFRLDTVAPTQSIISARTAADAMVWELTSDSGTLFFNTSAGFRTCVSGLSVNTWYLYAVGKPNGSATVRDHLCVMSTDTWTHADRGTLGDGSGTVDHLRFSDGAVNRVDGYYAAAAVYSSVLGDLAVEALRPGLSAWASAGPAALWRFNDTPVDDLVGTSDQASISGTTVDTGVEPPGFSYALGGAVIVPGVLAASLSGPTLTPSATGSLSAALSGPTLTPS